MPSYVHIADTFAWVRQVATPCVLIVQRTSPEHLVQRLGTRRTSVLIDDAKAAHVILQRLHLSRAAAVRPSPIAPGDSVVVAGAGDADKDTRLLFIDIAL
jgi:hypothetical protein